MHDSYLFLTPLLTFLVVALVGFVGCDQLFGIPPVDLPPTPPAPPTGIKAEPQNGEVVVSWTLYNGGGDKLKVKWGTAEGSHPDSHVIDDPSTIEYVVGSLTNGIPYYFVVSALKGAVESADSEEVNATPGLYGAVMPFVDPLTVQLGTPLRQFTGWLGMGFRTGSSALTLRELGRWFDMDINGTHEIQMVAASAPTVVLASVVVTKTATATSGEFLYQPVPSPITLEANTDYCVLSHEDASADGFHDASGTSVTIQNSASGTIVYSAFRNDSGVLTSGSSTTPPYFIYGPVDFMYTLP